MTALAVVLGQTVSAHIGGMPVEELIPAVAGAGGALLLARTWVWLLLRRRGSERTRPPR